MRYLSNRGGRLQTGMCLSERQQGASSAGDSCAPSQIGQGIEETNQGTLHHSADYISQPCPGGVASNEMCTFLILNISSLQLIPVNGIACRSQYGSVNPTAIVGPGILATAVSTLVAIAFCKEMDRRKRRV